MQLQSVIVAWFDLSAEERGKGGPPNISVEVDARNGTECPDTKSAAPVKNVRIWTDLPPKS